MHAQSKSFLNGRVTGAETEKNAYQFELSDTFSSGMVFRFIPKFKLRQLGDPVQYGDSLVLENEKL
jgi:hypothetical protein